MKLISTLSISQLSVSSSLAAVHRFERVSAADLYAIYDYLGSNLHKGSWTCVICELIGSAGAAESGSQLCYLWG
jgi:hypothetical protein